MLATILLVVLFVSFFIHIVFLAHYLTIKEKKFLVRFIVTAIINVLLMTLLSIVAFKYPHEIRKINIRLLLWALSGLIFFFLLGLKIVIFMRIYRRSKDPEYYHLNYFGKKVYNDGIIKKSEFLIMMASTPFFLFLGAYFVAKIINYFRTGHL